MIINILLLLSPYITFGFFESDLSPFYIVTIFCIFVIKCKSKHRYKYLSLHIILITGLILMHLNSIQILKFCATILISNILFYIGKELEVKKNDAVVISALWLSSGLVTLFMPEFFSTLFFRLGIAEGRGALGLTPEPSYFGVSSAFLYAIFLRISKNEEITERIEFKYLFPCLIFGLSVLVSLSIYGIVIFMIYNILYFPKLKTYIFIGMATLFFLLPFVIDADLRIFNLLNSIIESGPMVLLDDESISYRLENFRVILFALVDQVHEPALSGGITVLFIEQGIYGLITLMTLFIVSPWRKEIIKLSINIYTLPIILMIFVVGPMSNPFFWIFIGATSRIKNINHFTKA